MISLLPVLLFYYQQISQGNYSPEIITDYIVTEALMQHVDPQMALTVAKAESDLNPQAVGDHNTSFGIWQIHNPTQKSIRPLSINEAKDIIVSTNWAMKTMKEDNGCKQWSTCPIRSD